LGDSPRQGKAVLECAGPGHGPPVPGPTIDIHAGGIDNLARHHDYVLAIMESVTGKPYARFWLHGGHLLIGGKKMSKSRGTSCTRHPPLEGYTPEQIRFYLILGHYRERKNLVLQVKEAAAGCIGSADGASLRGITRVGPPHGGVPPLIRSLERDSGTDGR